MPKPAFHLVFEHSPQEISDFGKRMVSSPTVMEPEWESYECFKDEGPAKHLGISAPK